MDAEGAKIEYRAPSRLMDSLKLQFRCSLFAMRWLWLISAIVLVVLLALNAMSLLDDPWSILMPIAAGLVAGTAIRPAIVIVRHLFRRSPEIKADIWDQGIKIIGHQGFSYEATWPNLTWIKESPTAYVMRFNKLFVRLPKRGFVDQQEAAFRNLVRTQAPALALRLKA